MITAFSPERPFSVNAFSSGESIMRKKALFVFDVRVSAKGYKGKREEYDALLVQKL
jgi:hypothetical protein